MIPVIAHDTVNAMSNDSKNALNAQIHSDQYQKFNRKTADIDELAECTGDSPYIATLIKNSKIITTFENGILFETIVGAVGGAKKSGTAKKSAMLRFANIYDAKHETALTDIAKKSF